MTAQSSLRTIAFTSNVTPPPARMVVGGNEALINIALEQAALDRRRGLNTAGYISGYRGSPLGGLDQVAQSRKNELTAANVVFQPALNEDLAATAIWGTQQLHYSAHKKYDGVFGIWYGKGPGLDRSGDAIKHGNFSGTSPAGGVLLLVGDDPAAKSSTVAYQSEQALVAALIPVLNPADVLELTEFGLHGIAMSRVSGCWVGLKCLTDIVDGATSDPYDASAFDPVHPAGISGDVHIRWPDNFQEQERRMIRLKLEAAKAYVRTNKLDRQIIGGKDKTIGLVASGKTYSDLREALTLLGLGVADCGSAGIGVFKVGCSWPLEESAISEFALGYDEIVVVEEKRSLIEEQLARILYASDADRRPRLLGKRDPDGADLLPSDGELGPDVIAQAIAKRLAAHGIAFAPLQESATGESFSADLPARSFWYCAGCPHSRSTRTPIGSRTIAGIGCHTMAMVIDSRTIGATHMGGEGAVWIGQAPFTSETHVFQNIGDGTFAHSGLLAIRGAVVAGVNITFKILFNDAVAMTGGQAVDGALTVEQAYAQLVALGLRKVVVVAEQPERFGADAPFRALPRSRLREVEEDLRSTKGCTALIFDQVCAAEKRRRRKQRLLEEPAERIFINDRVCEGCGDCGVQSNCVAIKPLETPFGRKREIDQSNCNKDHSCVEGFCPSFLKVSGLRPRRKSEGSLSSRDHLPPNEVLAVPSMDTFNCVIVGIGGTGVVTTAAIVARAAQIEGFQVKTLDQTGLAQKNGHVQSHVRMKKPDLPLWVAKVPAGKANLVMGCDAVGAGSASALRLMREGRTQAVINADSEPLASFAQNPDQELSTEAYVKNVHQRIGRAATHTVEARREIEALTGNSTGMNLVVLGYALQEGLMPLRAEAVEQAIREKGVAVDLNLRAFRRGRELAVEKAERLPPTNAEGEETVEEIVQRFGSELEKYQSKAYARAYLSFVNGIAGRDLTDTGQAFTKAVARNLYKLMAYKDEYEVARLQTDGEFLRRIARDWEGTPKITFNFLPPALGALTGRRKEKVAFGQWFVPVLRTLAAFRFLRGTPFDPFGYAFDRRLERRLLKEYQSGIAEISKKLEAANYEIAVSFASLPMAIRGYGHVKTASVSSVQERWRSLQSELGIEGEAPVFVGKGAQT